MCCMYIVKKISLEKVEQQQKKFIQKKSFRYCNQERLKQRQGEFQTLEDIGRVQRVYKAAYLSSFSQHCFDKC